MICVYSLFFFFRFIILHAFKTLHSREIKTKTKPDKNEKEKKKKKISQTNKESFIRKYAQHGKHMIQRAKKKEKEKETSKNSPVCINVVLFHKQQVSNGLYNN